jgi:hypothetical protein
VTHEVRADEAGSAGDDDRVHAQLLPPSVPSTGEKRSR